MNIDDLKNGMVTNQGNLPQAQIEPFKQIQQPAPMQLESASTALAAQAKAATEARYIMAMHRPRNWDVVRQNLINECSRPSFAHNKSAYYKKPIGKGVEGLGIRFVEVALRCMTNVLVESSLIYEDELKEIHRVTVTELESNVTFPMDVKVTRTVERSKIPDGVIPFSVRKNSYDKDVFTIPATDDDLLNKRGALISKAIRTLGLRIIPGDLQDEAEAIIKRVRTDKAAQDPDAEAKRIIDAFSRIKVPIDQLTQYLGHQISTCSPSELVELRAIYGAIKDEETSWAAVMEERFNDDDDGKPVVNTDTGELFDPKIHISPDRVNQDGSYTKRKTRHKKKSGTTEEKPTEKLTPRNKAEIGKTTFHKCVTAMTGAKDLDELSEAREIGNDPEITEAEDAADLSIKLNSLYQDMEKKLSGASGEGDFAGME